MGLYDNYRLANSTGIPKYQGNNIGIFNTVMGQLQQRYDTAQQNDDMLNQAIKTSQASPFDQKLLDDLKTEYKNKIAARAEAGNYEDMWRETMLDSRDFVNKVKPIIQNAQAISEFQAATREKVGKGELDQMTADAAMKATFDRYKGLSIDKDTGEVRNQFIAPVIQKYINIPERINQYIKDMKPKVEGHTVEVEDNPGGESKFYITRGSKREYLGMDRLAPVVNAGLALDGEARAFINQQIELAPYMGTNYSRSINPDIIEKTLKDNPTYAALRAQGKTPHDAYEDIKRMEKKQELNNAIFKYSSKGIVDELTTTQTLEETAAYKEKVHQEFEDKLLPITVAIQAPIPGAGKEDPKEIYTALENYKSAEQDSYQKMQEWKASNGVSVTGTGSNLVAKDKTGKDVTDMYLRFEYARQQANKARRDLEEYDNSIRKQAGFVMTPEMEKNSNIAAIAELNERKKAIQRVGGTPLTPEQEAEQLAIGKNRYLKSSPQYEEYQRLLKENAKEGMTTVGLNSFTSKSLETMVKNTVSGVILNLDQNGLNAGTQGLVWASGKKNGKALSGDDDYQKLKGEVKNVYTGMDTDGQIKLYAKIGNATTNTKGEAVGEDVLVKMPIPGGLFENLMKRGAVPQAYSAITSQIYGLENTARKQVDIPVNDKGDVVRVKAALRSDKEYNNVAPGVEYTVDFPTFGNKFTQKIAGSASGVVDIINQTLAKSKQ